MWRSIHQCALLSAILCLSATHKIALKLYLRKKEECVDFLLCTDCLELICKEGLFSVSAITDRVEMARQSKAVDSCVRSAVVFLALRSLVKRPCPSDTFHHRGLGGRSFWEGINSSIKPLRRGVRCCLRSSRGPVQIKVVRACNNSYESLELVGCLIVMWLCLC